MNKTNVLFIMSDQHSAKHISCADKSRYGNSDFTVAKTPNLDRMAAGGVRFDNAITQNPICTPSRVCWVSGQYAHNTGYYALNGPNPHGVPTVFGHFRRYGYATGMIGKGHCPEYWLEDDCDVFLDNDHTSIGGSPEYDAYRRANNVPPDLMPPYRGGDGFPSEISYRDSREGWNVTQAKKMILDAQKAERPFFLEVSMQKPHSYYNPAQQFWDLYKDEELRLPPSAKGYDEHAAGKAPNLIVMADKFKTGYWTYAGHGNHEAGKLQKLHGYLGNVSQVDYAVGELLDFLKETGLEDDTIVIYSTDHGEYATEHDIMEKAPGICSDSVTRIPMIWQWKNHFPAGIVQKNIVETVDFSRTICKLCGIPDMETSDGEDITPLLKGEDKVIHDCGLTEFAWSKSLRMGDYRLVWYPEEMFTKEYPDGFGELYNLKDDPWEMKNLWFEPEYRHIADKMTKKLLNQLVVTTRAVTVHNINLPKSAETHLRYRRRINADGKMNVKQALKVSRNINYL